MAKRRILTALKISELSGVDRPCQEGALVSIMKRVCDDPCEEFVKVTFQAALDDANLEQRFNRAFYDSFESIYQLNDAFREALKDRYNDGEQTAAAYLESVAELARRAVDATSGLAKSATLDPEVIKAAIEAAISEAAEETTMNLYKNRAELVAAIAKFQKDGGTNEEIRKIAASAIALDAEDALPDSGAIAKRGSGDSAELTALKADLAKRDKVAALSADVRKHYDGLPAAEQDAFLALDAAAQTAAVTKATGDDPVVYTMANGMEITKSMGPAALILARGQDEMAKRLETVSGALVNADLAKRAATEIGNLAGDEATRIELLKAVDAIPDEKMRKAAMDTLRSANSVRKGAFTRVGTNASPADLNKGTGGETDDTPSGPALELENMAKAAMSEAGESGELAFTKHYAAVIETPKGRELYAETLANGDA